MFTAEYIGKTAPYTALDMQSSYKILERTEPDLRYICVTGAKTSVHIERRTQNIALKAFEGRLVGHVNDSNSYSVYNPTTRRVMESKTFVCIETPSRLPPPGEPQLLTHPRDEEADDTVGYNYTTDDGFLRDLRDHTSVLA